MSKGHNNFDTIANVYNLSRGYTEEVGKQIRESIQSIIFPNDHVALEIGAGTGLFTQYIFDNFHQYVAADISENMLRKLMESIHDTRIIPLVADATQLPFLDDVFHVVAASKVLRHIANWEQSLLEIKRVLRDDGVFIHAEEDWIEKPEASEIRPMWNQIVQDLGHKINRHPGPTANNTIVAGWEEIGAKEINVVTLAEWDVESQPAKVIHHLERRGGSSSLGIEDDVLAESIRRLKEWAHSKWSDLETIEVKRKCLQAVVVRV